MSRTLAFVLGLGLVLAPAAVAQKGDKGNPGDKGKADPRLTALLLQAGEVTGKVTRIGERGTSFSFQVSETRLQRAGRKGLPRPRVTVHNVQLEAAEDVVVRLAKPPLQFDEKGKPKPYTADELRELRGKDPSLPGYASDFGSLKPGSVVRLRLEQAKSGGKDAEPPREPGAGRGPVVTMIYVLVEGDLSGAPRSKEREKKKN
jgi:hypothetical protein